MDLIEQNARYSRADLLALRYEDSSRQRPSCANRIELQTLNFWKINGLPLNLSNVTSCNNSYISKAGLSPDRDNVSLSSSSGLLSSRRALRNRERAHNYYQRFTSGDQIGEDAQAGLASTTGNLCSASYKPLNIDHRSISSSHLMPAFAKRRFVVSTVGNIDPTEFQNEKSNASANYDEDLSNAKDIAPISFQCNADLKNHTRAASISLSSPLRRSAASAAEWESNEKHLNIQQDNEQSSLALSPTLLSGKQGSSINVQERRIGSGRLLPRNDNWEYKNKDADSLINAEKDIPQNGNIAVQQRQRTCSNKQTSERSNDNLPDRDRERRFNERRGADSIREQNDVKKNVPSGRRALNKEKFHFGDSTVQNRGKRMNMYQTHDRHEPEWFSAGPKSQHETIDLHGFDDIEYEGSSEVKTVKDTNKMETPTSTSSSIASLNVAGSNCNNNESSDTTQSNGLPSNRNNNVNAIAKSEIEFNFDAFLNMDPMGNDSEVQGEAKGTSRFSRWFASKEPTCGNELRSYESSSTLERQEMPSVKDLEAQMKKVDLRPEYKIINTIRNTRQLSHTDPREASVTRDTEGFKRILQQLGSQSNSHQPTESYPFISNVRGEPNQPNPNPHDRHQQVTRCQDSQIRDDLQLYHQRNIKNDSFQHGHVEVASQGPLHPSHTTRVNDPNILQTQTRMEIQHLLEGILRGDVSLEVLEKEINNPNTTTQSREIISAVLYECRNTLQQKLFHPNDLNSSVKNTQILNKNLASNVSEEFYSQNNPSSSLSQHIRHSNSPTPLAFTPTSVLRKMTADKEATTHNNSAINQQYQYQLSSQYPKPTVVHNMLNDPVIPAINQLQPRMILGGNYAMQHQIIANSPHMSPKQLPQVSQPRSQQNKWPPGNMQSSHGAKSFGRPILKGTLSSGSQQMLPVAFPLNNELHQVHQQRLKSVQSKETINNDNVHGGPQPPIQNVPYTDGIVQMHHHYMYQQQRPQLRHRIVHGDIHRQTNIQMQQSSAHMTGAPDAAESANFVKSNSLGPMTCHRDGRLSPTTNQLAQWFSPELLARASAGKLPHLNMNQALSLEEFERSMQHSSATVLN